MLLEPGLELSFGLNLFLQGPQCVQPRRNGSLPRALGVGLFLGSAPGLLEPRQAIADLGQSCGGLFGHTLCILTLKLQGLQTIGVGGVESLALPADAVTPRL